MAIEFNDNIHVKINRPTDFRFGPFISIAQANATIPIAQRYHGLIFGVYTTPLSIATSDIIYYYYWNGLSNTDIKQLGGKPPVDGSYANQAAMIAAQATQTAQYIYYDGTSYWEYLGTTNGNISDYREINNSITNPITGTGASGQVSFWTGTSTQSGDNGLFWDNVNKRLGIGTNAPLSPVHIKSNVTGTATSNFRIDNGGTAGNEVSLEFFSSTTSSTSSNRSGRINSYFTGPSFVNAYLTFQSLTTGNVLIDTLSLNNGNVLIGTTTAAGFRLDVNGTARIQGALTTNLTAGRVPFIGTGGELIESNLFTYDSSSGVLRVYKNINITSGIDTYVTSESDVSIYRTAINAIPSKPFDLAGSLVLQSRSSSARSIFFVTGVTPLWRWEIGTSGIFESNGAQTIRTSTGDLTIATNGGNGNIILNPEGTGTVSITDAKNISLGTTTGTKIGTSAAQKLALWNATPIVQPTTSVAAATRVGGGGTNITDTDTFDGYTLAQIVKGLRNMGAFA